MTVRQQIIDRVNSIGNPAILEEILNLIKVEAEFDETYKFNDAEMKAVNEGLADLNEGRSYSNETSKKMIAQWLKEQSDGL